MKTKPPTYRDVTAKVLELAEPYRRFPPIRDLFQMANSAVEARKRGRITPKQNG